MAAPRNGSATCAICASSQGGVVSEESKQTEPNILLTDRSTMEIDWDCGRKRWWYKDFGERGIVPVKEADYFITGRHIHSDLALIAEGVPWQEVVAAAGAPPANDSLLLEPFLRRLGWVTAFGKWLWPQLEARYEVVKVEWELVLERSPLWVAGTPDLILRDRTDKRLVVIDYKSVGSLGKGWMMHWPYAVQMHLNLKAIEEELGEAPKYAQVIGLKKGREEYGKLRHDYTWAYSDGESGWSKNWHRDWLLRPVSEYPGGVVGWVEQLGDEVGLQQFPFSAPIMLDERLLNDLIRARTLREQEVATHRAAAQTDEGVLNQHWEQRFSKCRPSFGDACPYLEACHNAEVNRDPIGSGLFVVRTPHHELELIGEIDEQDS